ncbi:hypothetical protein [Polyangium spumosum]|uniref:Uncharacterized protein n=1 Tax=Polyangium spumosum TaxID=889282 RepID=A0A6N7PKC1_9BACT|nr:hypothetical protein [Polyangium spumosum]MRG92493.1 hypothetical protein [Polyangium spumosum]
MIKHIILALSVSLLAVACGGGTPEPAAAEGAPADQAAPPAGGEAAPADQAAPPAGGEAAPAGDQAAPADAPK